jgi:type I restriction enzyme S subunit
MNTKQLRQKILDLAIRGKLVQQDPNDEPASALVAKIRAEKERLIKEKKIKRDKNESFIFRGEDKSHYEKFVRSFMTYSMQ